MLFSTAPKETLPRVTSGAFPGYSKCKYALVEECNGLHSGDFKTLATAHVLAHYEVVTADHVGAGLGKLGAIAFVGASGKLPLLGAYQPGQLIFVGLLAVRAVQVVGLFGLFLVKEVAFFHTENITTKGTKYTKGQLVFTSRASPARRDRGNEGTL